MSRCTIALLFLTLPLLVSAQEKKRADATKLKEAGYTNKQIEGFTVMVSDETVKQNDESNLERKPLDALAVEIQMLAKVCPSKILGSLRKVPIWIEWNQIETFTNGREGAPIAVYYGGHQSSRLRPGMSPHKANSVTILRMSRLAEAHQPKKEIGSCILLHEMAHAVHMEILGEDHAGIKAAYKQAMERKLLDPVMYAATNEKEFFAELTLAYFDQLIYIPRTRAELKKHDPVTFRLMEGIWGKAPVAAGIVPQIKAGPEAPPLAKAPLGTQLQGTPITAESLQGCPVVLVYWMCQSPSCMLCLPKVSSWDAEMGELGLKTIAIHLTGQLKADVLAAARSRQLGVPVFEAPARKGEVINDPKELPVAMVYDQEGVCIFRGAALEADTALRQVVGYALLAKSGIEVPSGALAGVVQALRAGKPAFAQLSRLYALSRSDDAAVQEQAKALIDALTEGPRRNLEEAEQLAESNPVEAFVKIERLTTTLKDTPLGTQAATLVAKLKQTKAVAAELKARPDLAKVKKLDADLSSRAGSFNPLLPDFQSKNAATIKQLGDAVQQMKKTHANTKAMEEALDIASKYGAQVR
jgi:Anthrax toxin lethal factor, N- and C-terminal domain